VKPLGGARQVQFLGERQALPDGRAAQQPAAVVLGNVDTRGSITLCIDHLHVLWSDISRLPATMKFFARCGEPPCWSLRITM
jgi:hypothetical protein